MINSVERKYSGALGLGPEQKKVTSPVKVDIYDSDGNEINVVDIACGFNYSTVIDDKGKVYSCGQCGKPAENRYFQDWLFSTNLSTVGYTLDQIENKQLVNWNNNSESDSNSEESESTESKSKLGIEDIKKQGIIPYFTQVPFVDHLKFTKVDGGEYQNMLVDEDNKLYQ